MLTNANVGQSWFMCLQIKYILALHDYVSMLSTVLIWRHIALCGFAAEVSLLWNLNLRLFCARKCIWYPFSCDMGLDGTLTIKPYRTRLYVTHSIWLVRVPSKPISHSNGYHMHIYHLRSAPRHAFSYYNIFLLDHMITKVRYWIYVYVTLLNNRVTGQWEKIY